MEVMEGKKSKKYGKYDEWEIESCADCLMRAEEIKKDPEKLEYVMKYLKKKESAVVSSIEELREIAQQKGREENEEEYDS